MKQSPFIYDTNIIQNFTNGLFGSVRSILINGEPWFVGNDVAKCLGYSDTDKAIRQHVYDHYKTIINLNNTPPNQRGIIPGNPNMIIINEAGLYQLIFSSKLPMAETFQRWIFEEVLPTMRQIGFTRSMQILQEENMRLQQENFDLKEENMKLENNNIILYDDLKNQEIQNSILEDRLIDIMVSNYY